MDPSTGGDAATGMHRLLRPSLSTSFPICSPRRPRRRTWHASSADHTTPTPITPSGIQFIGVSFVLGVQCFEIPRAVWRALRCSFGIVRCGSVHISMQYGGYGLESSKLPPRISIFQQASHFAFPGSAREVQLCLLCCFHLLCCLVQFADSAREVHCLLRIPNMDYHAVRRSMV